MKKNFILVQNYQKILLLLFSVLILDSCEFSLEPDNNSKEQTIFDLSGAAHAEINPSSKHYFNLDKNEYGGLYCNVKGGQKYFISVKIEKGKAETYYSQDSEID